MEKKILKQLQKNNYASVGNLMRKMPMKSNIKILNLISNKDLINLAHILKKDFLAKIILNLSTEKKQVVLETLNDKELNKLLDDLSTNKTIQIIEETSYEIASKVIKLEEINYLLNTENYTILVPLLSNMKEDVLAKNIEQTKPSKVYALFSLIPRELGIRTFAKLSYPTKYILLNSMSDNEIKDLMAGLIIDETVTLIKEMPYNISKKIMSQSSEGVKEYIDNLARYPKNSVARCMSKEYIAVSPKSTVRQCLNLVKNSNIKSKNIYNVYVINDNEKLMGAVAIKKLIQANSTDLVEDVMDKNIIVSQTTDNKKNVAKKIFDYSLIAMPIVNNTNQLVGVVSIDNAVYITKTESNKRFSTMNALKPNTSPYLKTSVGQIWKNRVPWLLILLLSATFTGLILNSYESRLNAISPVLFACVPMMMDTGGNCGSQSSVTVIRALSLNELTLKDWWRVLLKEILASLMLGLTLAGACFVKLLLIDNLLFGYVEYTVVRSLVVSVALFATVVIAKITGCLLPLIAKKCKLDPAVMAAPFITTIVDSLSLILFCSMSVAILTP